LLLKKPLTVIPLHYIKNTVYLLDSVATFSHPVFLSTLHTPETVPGSNTEAEKWEVLSAEPFKIWNLRPEHYKNTWREILVEIESTQKQLCSHLIDNPHTTYPFSGGILGSISYEFGAQSLTRKVTNQSESKQSLFFAGLYLWAIMTNHAAKSTVLIIHPDCPLSLRKKIMAINWAKPFLTTDTEKFTLTSTFKYCTTRQHYEYQFHQIKNYISNGDCYQVNLAQQFTANYTGSPVTAFKNLFNATQTPFSGYVDLGNAQILSFSPERFLLVDSDYVETKPIKGTRPRHQRTDKDKLLKESLLVSQKDRAENLMIVDLLRNDLGKFCKTGSVKVAKLFDIESFHNVHHLVSTITGKLRAEISPLRLLTESMPGGSITGAPKIRSMEIIAELEKNSRGPYCGSLFLWDCCGRLDSNIAIRTLLCDRGKLFCWGGGGIVYDSQLNEEYQESIDKVSFLMRSLEGM